MALTNTIETVGLNFSFRNQSILKNLSLQVPQGSIYGFLGPNGAGKTTTIKILLNLLKAPKDTVFLFGKEINANRIAILKKVGALVEQPAIYGHLTGKENLINRCILLGIKRSKAEDLLKLVDLKAAAHKKAKNYSLGMKQRLGIALALISEPELLLLDEPTNGLDPNGIIEMRNLMIELSSQHQKTILVSSHLLSEIEKIVSHVGIINKGQLLYQGTTSDLHLLNKPTLAIQLNDVASASAFLAQAGTEIIKQTATGLEVPFISVEESSRLNTLLVQQGYAVSSLTPQRKDLENLYLSITQNQ